MRTALFRYSSLTACAALTLLLLPARATAQVPADARARADSLLALHAPADAPGVSVAVVRDGAIVYSGARGLASLEQGTPLTTRTILDIGSVAKQFTGFAVALLESQGKLSLEDDIRKYLPEVTDFGRPITIRNLLNHTSGLREIYNTMQIGGWQNGDAMTQEHALRIVSVQPELQFEPGSEHLYNNTGYMLLADIVERVTGSEFHVWMEENVFRPLGMRNTVIMHRLGQVIPGSADSYSPLESGGFTRVFDNSTLQGAGGIYSTAEDMTQWVKNWSSPVIGSSAVLERMQERTVLTSGDTLAYALGVNVSTERGLRSIAHGGSSAGFRTAFLALPEVRGGVIVQSNNAGINSGRLARELGELFFSDRLTPVVAAGTPAAARPVSGEAPGWEPATAELAAFAGRFYSTEVEALYRLSVESDTLVLRHGRLGTIKLTPQSRDTFRAAGSVGELKFVRNASGAVTGFSVANGRTRGVTFSRM